VLTAKGTPLYFQQLQHCITDTVPTSKSCNEILRISLPNATKCILFSVIVFQHYVLKWVGSLMGTSCITNWNMSKIILLTLNTWWREIRQLLHTSGMLEKTYTENSNNKNKMFCLPEHYIKILSHSWPNINYLCAEVTVPNILILNSNVTSCRNLLIIKCTHMWTTHGSKIHFWQERSSYLICKLNK
jgi:hypothetical protein